MASRSPVAGLLTSCVKRSGDSLPVSSVIPQPVTDSGPLGTLAKWFKVTGNLVGHQVIVHKAGDIAILTRMGGFGTRLRERMKVETASERVDDDAGTDVSEEPIPKRFRVESSSGSMSVDTSPTRPALRPPVQEDSDDSLVLSCYEAFYLVHAVGVLTVHQCDGDSSRELTMTDLWKRFTNFFDVFPYHYAVYLFYRSNGWTPKPALRCGAHFTLYPQGPDYFHSVYSIRVHLLSSESMPPESMALCAGTARDLMTAQRSSRCIDKKLVVCTVTVPELPWMEMQPSDIPRLHVRELRVKRFHPERR